VVDESLVRSAYSRFVEIEKTAVYKNDSLVLAGLGEKDNI
jgi:hypothetical protein